MFFSFEIKPLWLLVLQLYGVYTCICVWVQVACLSVSASPTYQESRNSKFSNNTQTCVGRDGNTKYRNHCISWIKQPSVYIIFTHKTKASNPTLTTMDHVDKVLQRTNSTGRQVYSYKYRLREYSICALHMIHPQNTD